MNSREAILAAALAFAERGQPCVLVTLVSTSGSAPADAGASLLVTEEGLHTGTVGGGKVEAAALRHASELLQQPGARDYQRWHLQKDIGMTCGGSVHFFFERLGSDGWTLAIFGAGHVSQALVRTLLPLHCRILVYDTRRAWIDKLPQAPQLKADTIETMADAVDALPENTYALCLSQGHATDRPVLKRLLEAERFPFIGVIGSEAKANTLRRELAAEGVREELLKNFHCPVGLPIGNNQPAEIAISIVAQLLQVRGA